MSLMLNPLDQLTTDVIAVALSLTPFAASHSLIDGVPGLGGIVVDQPLVPV